MKKLALLNTSIITAPGTYSLSPISLDEAREMVNENRDNLLSAIGHQGTAEIMSTLLNADIQVNRIAFSHELGQDALVFKLRGRPEEGKILVKEEIEAIGYDFYVLSCTQSLAADLAEEQRKKVAYMDLLCSLEGIISDMLKIGDDMEDISKKESAGFIPRFSKAFEEAGVGPKTIGDRNSMDMYWEYSPYGEGERKTGIQIVLNGNNYTDAGFLKSFQCICANANKHSYYSFAEILAAIQEMKQKA